MSEHQTIPRKHFAKTLSWYASLYLCLIIPVIGSLLALALLPWLQPDLTTIITFLVFWSFTLGIGISVGYHRLFCHRAFATSAPIRFFIGVCGSMAGQGPIISWVATHRCHHKFSDEEHDPHSPWPNGDSFWKKLSGLYHAHFNWLMTYDMPNPIQYCPDLLRDKVVSNVSRSFMVWYLFGLLLPAIIVGLITHTWSGALLGFLWGGCVRVFVTFHTTWCINSICHFFGQRPYQTNDHSTNLAWLSLFSFGESWHNNHHAYPSSAAFGHRFWQIDLGYYFILSLKVVGLATNIKTPELKERI